ncbi:hypothetical protein OH77DRAFT_822448 [Trametes cingulata]|nr:hypothetical protein OH77DRAFT_822448 [Trametes cingulata]
MYAGRGHDSRVTGRSYILLNVAWRCLFDRATAVNAAVESYYVRGACMRVFCALRKVDSGTRDCISESMARGRSGCVRVAELVESTTRAGRVPEDPPIDAVRGPEWASTLYPAPSFLHKRAPGSLFLPLRPLPPLDSLQCHSVQQPERRRPRFQRERR